MTEPEVMLWSRLRHRRWACPIFRRQHPIGPYILDFYAAEARLAVEIDGSSHGEDARIGHDQRRDSWLKAQDVTVYRTSASTVVRDVDQVADVVRLYAMELVERRKG